MIRYVDNRIGRLNVVIIWILKEVNKEKIVKKKKKEEKMFLR